MTVGARYVEQKLISTNACNKTIRSSLSDTQHKDFIDFYNIYEKPVHPELIRRNISYVDTQKCIHALTADGEIMAFRRLEI